MSIGSTIGFTCGILMIVFGVYFLSSQAPDRTRTELEDGISTSHDSSSTISVGTNSPAVSRRSSLITLLAPDMILSPRYEMAGIALSERSYRSVTGGGSYLFSPKKSSTSRKPQQASILDEI